MRRLAAAFTVAAASATTLRDLCPNKDFEPTLEDVDDPVLRGPPYREPRNTNEITAAVAGKRGLEIGGPTELAGQIYDIVASCDNMAEFPDHFHNRPELVDGGPFAPNGVEVGRTLQGDATTLLSYVEPASYDLLFASHVLEHTRDPLGVLLDWDRALKPNGTLFLILPWKADTSGPGG